WPSGCDRVGGLSDESSGQPLRGRRGLCAVRKVDRVRRRPQQRLHYLVSGGFRGDFGVGGKQADDALHLSRIDRHQRRCIPSGGGPVTGASGSVLECVLPEGNRLSKLLAKGDAGARPHEIQRGSSAAAAAAIAALQRTVRTARRLSLSAGQPSTSQLITILKRRV